jgi:N-acetyl-beta-hexosaminidase
LAEQVAEQRYVEDLESAAKTLATVRKRPASKRKGGKRHS